MLVRARDSSSPSGSVNLFQSMSWHVFGERLTVKVAKDILSPVCSVS